MCCINQKKKGINDTTRLMVGKQKFTNCLLTNGQFFLYLNLENNKRGNTMTNIEYIKWFRENLVSGEMNPVEGIYNYTVAGYSFTTNFTKNKQHLTLYDVTNGKVRIATRIYVDYGAIEDSIYVYLYKKMGITEG